MDRLAPETFELVFSYLEPCAVIRFGLISQTRLRDPLVVKCRDELAEALRRKERRYRSRNIRGGY